MPLEQHVTYVDPDEELERQLREKYPQYYSDVDVTGGFVCGQPGGLLVFHRMIEAAPLLRNFQVREDDVFVRTFPKSGTTWTLELISLLLNDLDTEKAKLIIQEKRVPYFETTSMLTEEELTQFSKQMDNSAEFNEGMSDMVTLETIAKRSSPRCIKSHLPMYCLPPNILDICKVIYVARNPKDVIVSSYHFALMQPYSKDLGFEAFAQTFVDNQVMFAPYWKHVLFLFYEDMKKGLPGEIRKVAAFLSKNITDDQVSKLADHLSFRNMKESGLVKKDKVFVDRKQADRTFMRKGQIGDWVNQFSPELLEKVDRWIEENTRGTGLSFVDKA